MANIRVNAARYADHDDCLTAAAEDYADEHDLEGWKVEASWEDDDERDWIVLTVRDSA